MAKKTEKKAGAIIAINGIVVDIHFAHDTPKMRDAVKVQSPNAHGEEVIIEVLQSLEGQVFRGIAMSSTDGLRRGDEVINTGNPIVVPVGKEVL